MTACCEYCGRSFRQRYDWQTLCPDCYRLRQAHGGKDGWIKALGLQREVDTLRLQLAMERERRMPTPPCADRLSTAERALINHVRENPRSWLLLTHPDKHGGSQAATEITRLLLAVRAALSA